MVLVDLIDTMHFPETFMSLKSDSWVFNSIKNI